MKQLSLMMRLRGDTRKDEEQEDRFRKEISCQTKQVSRVKEVTRITSIQTTKQTEGNTAKNVWQAHKHPLSRMTRHDILTKDEENKEEDLRSIVMMMQ